MYTGPVITYTRAYTDTDSVLGPKYVTNFSEYSYLSPFLGHVVLSHLKPKTTYFYRIKMMDANRKEISGSFNGRFTTLSKT